jgi:small subunit ribosomal protein S11
MAKILGLNSRVEFQRDILCSKDQHFHLGTSTDENLGMKVHIHSSSNNTILTFTDHFGQVKAWNSAGASGFKGARRSTNYAAQQAAEILAKKIRALGFQTISVQLKGLGSGRESSVRGLKLGGLKIQQISDLTPIPHNGCRPPKKRRF